MLERNQRKPEEIYAKNLVLLNNSQRELLPSGDIRYISSDQEVVRFNPKYEQFFSQLLQFVDLESTKWDYLHDTARRRIKRKSETAVVAKIQIERNAPLAIKYIRSTSLITEIEQFNALRAIQEEGYLVAEPILATNASIIMEWVTGKKPDEGSTEWYSYIRRFGDSITALKKSGRIKENLHPDFSTENFRTSPQHVQQESIKTHYISFDPVW